VNIANVATSQNWKKKKTGVMYLSLAPLQNILCCLGVGMGVSFHFLHFSG
jgi:hypothetical protein